MIKDAKEIFHRKTFAELFRVMILPFEIKKSFGRIDNTTTIDRSSFNEILL